MNPNSKGCTAVVLVTVSCWEKYIQRRDSVRLAMFVLAQFFLAPVLLGHIGGVKIKIKELGLGSEG